MNYTGYNLKTFPTQQSLLDTLPKRAIKVLNQWLEKHAILLPSVVPPKSTNIDYSFDINGSTFHGPFGDDSNWLQVEQKEKGKPKFYVWWVTDDPS